MNYFDAIERLFGLLHNGQISHLLLGSIALLLYMEGRNPENIDLILDRRDLGAIDQLVINEDCSDVVSPSYHGIKMKVQLTENLLFEQVQQQFAIETTIQQHRIACATPQGLVILKLRALPALYRAGKFDRAALYEMGILLLALAQPVDFAAALGVVEPYLSDFDRITVRNSAISLTFSVRLFRKVTLNLNLEVTFDGAFGKHRNSSFPTHSQVGFKRHFAHICGVKVVEGIDHVLGIASNRAMHSL